jgi:nanoRNase/pAp phosphatase (c-di-AMP/oligoRNAs hydrolase)
MEQTDLEGNGEPAEEIQPVSLPEPSLGFREILEAHRKERHVIVLQNYPDPDAIASAFAHELISAEFDIEIDILYAGKISHQQNLALVKLLGIALVSYNETLDLSQYQGAIFVDNQGTTCGEIVRALEAVGVPPLIVVDHHELQNRLEPEYSDIRRTLGATSTIYAEYLETGGLVEMDRSRREHVLVATALFHGLMTDTDRFIRANAEDFQAAAFLSRYRDADILDQIMSQARSKQTMEVIRSALENRVVVENFSIAGIGYLRAEDRDAIPQAADFLLTEENVHTAVVYGIVTGDDLEERVIGSMRTSKLTLDPDDFIKDVFGKDAVGQYFGGGKMSAGGFEIPLGFLAGGHAEDFRDIKWQVFDNQIKQKMFAKIGIDGKPRESSRNSPPNP